MPTIDDQLRASLDCCTLGRFDEAAAILSSVLAARPRHAEALRQTGLLDLQAGRDAAAVARFESAAKAEPKRPDLKFLLGAALFRSGALERGKALLALAGADLKSAKGCLLVADLAAQIGDPELSESMCLAALAIEPRNIEARSRCASSQHRTGRAADAAAILRAGIALDPDNTDLHRALTNVLPYSDAASAADMRSEIAALGALISRSVTPLPPPSNSREPERPLRIGYVAQDISVNSAIARFIEAPLVHHDRANFHITCYCVEPTMDRISPRIRAGAESWVDATPLNDDALAARIRSDRIDILLDLTGHTKGSRPGVLARRPAPIQGTFIGDAKTTGLPGIDFKFIDAITDPPGAEAAYTECLIRLEGPFLCYKPHDEMPEPALHAGPAITFASFNVSEKIGPAVIDLWSRVLHEVPGSSLLLKATSFGYELTRRVYRERFSARGIAPDRIRMLGHTLFVREHYATYHNVDIALDPFPYNGTTTNCDALWMGVPVVTLRGSLHAGRVGASLLTAVGLSDLIASSPDEFVSIASRLAADSSRRTALRATLRPTFATSAIGDAPRYAAKVEAALRALWRDWCAGGLKPS